MKFKRWTWGYVPVALVLGLIWFEFLRGSANSPAPPPTRVPETQASGTPATAGTPLPNVAFTPPIEPVPVPEAPTLAHVLPPPPPPPPPPPAPPAPPAAGAVVIDDVFIGSPPRISLEVSNASLNTVVEEMRKAFGQPSYLQVRASSPQAQTFTLQAKNATFWEILRQMQASAGVDFFPTNTSGRISTITGGTTVGGVTDDTGLVIGPGNGIHHFVERGAVILIPMQIQYNRTFGAERSPPRYILHLGTAVDPRVPVVRSYPVEILEITDDIGRNISVIGSGVQTASGGASNYWTSTATFSPPEARVTRIHLKAQVRFQVQLSEITATLDDAAARTGEVVALGDRRLSLTRSQVSGSQFQLQFSLVNPEPQPPVINITFSDSNGKSVALQMRPGLSRSIPTTGYVAPYRLTFRTPDRTYDAAVGFDVKDISLP